MAGALEGDLFIGNKAQENRGLLSIRYPIEHGIVKNWEDIEKIWSNVFQNDLKTNIEDHPILLTEAPLNPKRNREKCCELLFEAFNCPAIYLSIQAILSLYASGKTTGIVLDSGDGVSHVVPVYEGFSLPSAIKRIDIAGRDITEHLQLLLRKNGILLNTSSEKEIVRLIKEKHCFVSSNVEKDESLIDEEVSYKLPDGQIIKIGNERFRSTEILFKPSLIGEESNGIDEILVESLLKIDIDLRDLLYKNILLSGGNTLIKGFGDRLIQEIKDKSPKGNKIKIFAPVERKYSTWIGGSVLAGLSTFKKMWVNKAEFEENPNIIHSKCL